GFFGVFAWNVLIYWFFRYLEVERGFGPGQTMVTMLIAIAALSLGYIVGGSLSDYAFERTPRGRAIVGGLGALIAAILLWMTMSVPVGNVTLFTVLLALAGVALSTTAPNAMATVPDITLPEVRSSAQAVRKLVEDGGAALAPWLAGLIAVRASLHTAIIAVSVSTLLMCALIFAIIAYYVPEDVEALREKMEARARALT
ncbi:MAG: MFS transporter, partial [Anaerolineae bacterium]